MVKVMKKTLSVFMVFLICIGVFSGMTLSIHAVESGQVYCVAIPRSNDPLQNGWGHPEMPLINGWYAMNERLFEAKSMDGFTGNTAYCIEVGISLHHGDILSSKGEDFWEYYPSELNSTLSPIVIKSYIGRIMQYGWTGQNDPNWSTNDPADIEEMAELLATQLLIWETVIGERDINFNHVAVPAGTNRILDFIGADHPLKAQIYRHYDEIVEKVQNHSKVPSFCTRNTAGANEYELTYNGSEYTVTLTDTNNVLRNYNFTSETVGVTFSVSGNKLTINMKNSPTGTVSVKAEKVGSQRRGVITWTDGITGQSNNGQLQDLVTYSESISDPVSGFFNLKVSYGNAKIIKTSEDGKVDNISFTISGNSINKTVKTNSVGEVLIDNLIPGIYTVSEQSYDKYEPQNVQRVTVESAQTSTVTFNNTLRRGNLTVTKTAEDGLTQGMKFHLYGTSLSGLPVDEYATVGSDGKAFFEEVLIGQGYTLEEVDIPNRYVVPAKQTATIEWNKVTEKIFNNRLKKWNLTVTKSDSETGTSQGDASLAGAVYGIYKGEQLIDTYTTSTDGQFTTRYYTCGEDWSVREISPSEGYLLDQSSYHIGAESQNYTVEYNSTLNDVTEQIIKGNVAIIKHTNDGSTQIETPETGAVFEIYLKKSGSYECANESERDILICDEYGFAQTKDMPYGIYTVHQTKGWDGREFLKDFDVYISDNGQTYRYLINNANFESYIKVIKTDAESGLTIPYAGAAFQLYDPDGNKIVMSYTYPEYTEIDTFYTTADGMLITPQKLAYGQNYSLVETHAPYGYVLDSTPVYFDVAADTAAEDGTITVVKVNRPNMPQKGRITIAKTGEVFSSVTVIGDGYIDENGNDISFPSLYMPVYSAQGLADAVYEVRAAEDIYTPDGTLRYAKGSIVSEVTTDRSGKAVTHPLYLGKYEIREIKAPYGMLLNEEIHFAELTYAGQDIEITDASVSFHNERQKFSVSLEKFMEQNEKFNIGQNNEILSVQFGLFAAEDLIATDGSIIPKDGLLETVRCDANGKAVFSADLPAGASCYVKEIATDNQYILSDEKFPVVFEYAGQEFAVVNIRVNDGAPIINRIIKGAIKGLKIDRETEETISGAIFGLFASNETVFTEESALLTAESSSDGVFIFEGVPYGNWLVKELKPAENFLPNEEIYPVQIANNEEILEITALNDKIPEIGTKAAVDGEKEIGATEVFTLEDIVSYQQLIPGKEYTVSGVLMDKATSEPLLINGEEIHAETIFVPDTPSGEVIVSFSFDSKYIKTDTDIVVFESLYRDGKELAVHADIEDEDQTVTVKVPVIGTTATVEDEQKINATEVFTLEDVVAFQNLTPGKEYVIKGILMDKTTGKVLVINGKGIRSEVKFVPKTTDGEVVVSFVFDSRFIKADTDIVAYETLYRENVEIASHADIEDRDQTVSVFVPEIGTRASIDGNKESIVKDRVTIEDIVSYKNLTPGKEYIIKGILMDKSTGKALLIDGKEVYAETTFIPNAANGEITLAFTFEGKYLKKTTEIVVFEMLYREDMPIAVHSDIEDAGQTVTVQVPPPPSDSPQTGDTSHIELWLALIAVSGAAIVLLSVRRRRYSK